MIKSWFSSKILAIAAIFLSGFILLTSLSGLPKFSTKFCIRFKRVIHDDQKDLTPFLSEFQ